MSIDPAFSRRLPGFRPWMAVVPLAAVAVAGLGVLVLRAPLPGAGPVGDARIAVEVVAPVEPEVQPGGTMEVGDLVDGYTHVAIQPQAAGADAYDADVQTAWVEPLPPLRAPEPAAWSGGEAVVQPTQAQPQEQDGPFGFDAPGPDYAAERRARQARLDRVQAEQAARGAAGAPVTSPGLDRDSAFY
jgi:hypothetical protein